MTRACKDCSAPITRQSKTGRCRPCTLTAQRADPEWNRRRLEGLAAKVREPEYLRNLSAGLARAHRERWENDPEYRERCRAKGRQLKATGLGNAAQPKGSPSRLAVGQKLSDQRLGQWCPREYRALYQELRRTKGKGAREARRLVEQKIRADKGAMTPFERQLEAIRRGAGIVEVMPIRSASPAYSLYGNGSALCADFAP